MGVGESASRRTFLAFRAFFAFRTFFAGRTFFAFRTGTAFRSAQTFFARCAGSAVLACWSFLSGRPGFAGLALQRLQYLRAYLLGRVDQVVLGRERAAAHREYECEGGGDVCVGQVRAWGFAHSATLGAAA